MPDAHMHKLRVGPFVRSMREAPLTLTTLAALVPGDPDIEVKLVDGSVDPVPLDDPADLVGISVITGCAPSAYAMARHYRERGTPVVLGGVHVSVLPGEAIEHADAIVIGRGESAWPRLIEDFRRGRMKRVYREHTIGSDVLEGVPTPRRDLQRKSGYMMPNSVQATRGCRRKCDFCSVPAVWPKYLKRPVADVIRDIKAISGNIIAFNDVSLVDDAEYARELFTAMIPLRKRWGGLVTADSLQDTQLLDLMVESGCVYLLVGFESGDQATLRRIRKSFNQTVRYKDVVAMLQRRGITIQGCFVFGFDHDDKSVFESTVNLVQDLGIDIPRYSLYTPYPGTPLFARLMEERRILSFNWNDYDTMHVVIQPAQMSPGDLYSGFKWAYRESFRLHRIAQRVARPDLRCPINFVGNLCYRIFVHRLYHERRFASPYSVGDPGRAPGPEQWQVPAELEETPCRV
ncbi:B12-binding domain-containing radical SAM protein [uncultured Paludibaculum sp.]|uniref:B12-binding domain-containing radical SAM protein n=1 Tax=uncultured Paludibaculum sp. TaxID=1765020 RepID=UPI002AAAA2D5|nr:radical SAM protein [uncultured Paludibaculum sp.]